LRRAGCAGYTGRVPRAEPVVRIRCPPEDEARCVAALAKAGLTAERSLTWLVVRDASPDTVNDALAAGGADPRTVVRMRIGQLVGWLLDRQGAIQGRGANLTALVSRVIEEGGLAARYRPRPEPALLAAAAELYEHLLATGAGFVSWDRFVEWCCEQRDAAAPGGAPTGSRDAAG
jgi:hypothetical protein